MTVCIDGDDASRDLGYVDTPEYTAGLNVGFSWKGWDFSTVYRSVECMNRMLSGIPSTAGRYTK